MMDRLLRVLIVDDSAYVRKVIRQMLSRSPFLEVVGTAHDAEEALTLVAELRPDVVTLDLIMPGMGGLGFIREQMAKAPVPIVVVSIASESSQMVLDALDAGAIDVVQKPSALATEKVLEMADELVERVKAAGSVRLAPVRTAANPPGARGTSSASRRIEVVVIGVSTGGPQALKYLVPRLPADFPVPLAIVMHMPVGYTELYAKRLNDLCALRVFEAEEGSPAAAGSVLIAPAGRHLTFLPTGGAVVAHLDAHPFDTLHRPSVDVLFRSAGEVFGGTALGVVMTGMGTDGKDGSSFIKSKGGFIVAEAEESCAVFGMPRAVIEAGLADRTIPLEGLPEAIVEAAYGINSRR